jgi:hypothetical protein
MTAPLQSSPRCATVTSMGGLCVSVARGRSIGEEDTLLLLEVAGDIACALHDIDLAEHRKKSEARSKRASAGWRPCWETCPGLRSDAAAILTGR